MRSDNRDVSGPSFRFRLERVRALRKHGEDLAKQELAGALTRRSACAEALRADEARLDDARTAHRDAGAAPLSATELVARQAYLERMERSVAAAALDLDLSDDEVASRRDVLAQAARARETLERLKERQRSEHARELARREGVELDEIALNVFRRGAA